MVLDCPFFGLPDKAGYAVASGWKHAMADGLEEEAEVAECARFRVSFSGHTNGQHWSQHHGFRGVVRCKDMMDMLRNMKADVMM